MTKAKEYAEKFILTVDHQGDVEEAYNDGYKQAEKDMELTWEDMEQIYNICCEVFLDYEVTRTNMQKIWKEVLERFNEKRK